MENPNEMIERIQESIVLLRNSIDDVQDALRIAQKDRDKWKQKYEKLVKHLRSWEEEVD